MHPQISIAENTGGEFSIFAIKFGIDGGKVLLSLQSRTKWNTATRNCKVGDIVLLKNEAERNQWPMAKTVATEKMTREMFQV